MVWSPALWKARTKLIPATLNRFFIFGAYGSDSPDRAELTKLAIEKAKRLHDQLASTEVYVVGDTERRARWVQP